MQVVIFEQKHFIYLFNHLKKQVSKRAEPVNQIDTTVYDKH